MKFNKSYGLVPTDLPRMLLTQKSNQLISVISLLKTVAVVVFQK